MWFWKSGKNEIFFIYILIINNRKKWFNTKLEKKLEINERQERVWKPLTQTSVPVDQILTALSFCWETVSFRVINCEKIDFFISFYHNLRTGVVYPPDPFCKASQRDFAFSTTFIRSSTIADRPGMLGRAGADAGAGGMASLVITEEN